MATRYTGPSDADETLLKEMIRLPCHEALVKDKIAVALVMAHPDLDDTGMPKADAVKHAGHAVVAKCRLVTPLDYLLMHRDIIILVDAWRWEDLKRKQRLALLDHELTHIEVPVDADGNARRHPGSAKQVMLRLRPDDWFLTGFADVIQRHGTAALEAQSLTTLGAQYRQMNLPGLNDLTAA